MALQLPITTRYGLDLTSAYVRLVPRRIINLSTIEVEIEVYANARARSANSPPIPGIGFTQEQVSLLTFVRTATEYDLAKDAYLKLKPGTYKHELTRQKIDSRGEPMYDINGHPIMEHYYEDRAIFPDAVDV